MSGPREELFELPFRLVRQGGPSSSEHASFRSWLDATDLLVRAGRVPREAVLEFWRSLGPDYLAGCAQGHALAKPYGYAGDFEMMEKIYRCEVSGDPRFRGWDLFFHLQPAPCAVRNRGPYFASLLDEVLARLRHPLRVLDVGCGPAYHLAGWLNDNPSAPVEIVCIDNDERALAKAAAVCGGAGGRVRFEHANALRFKPPGTFDLIWSSGLFDYLSDGSFARLAARYRAGLRPGGEIAVGNFAPDNPGRAYMELVGDWHLRYRSEAELRRLAGLSGAAPGEVRVGCDRTGVNLFLHLGAETGA